MFFFILTTSYSSEYFIYKILHYSIQIINYLKYYFHSEVFHKYFWLDWKKTKELCLVYRDGLTNTDYSQTLSHYCLTRRVWSAAFRLWTGSPLLRQPGHPGLLPGDTYWCHSWCGRLINITQWKPELPTAYNPTTQASK